MMGIIEGIGAAVGGVLSKAQDLRSAITGEITPDKQAEIVIRAQEIEAELLKAQAAINLADARSKSKFQAWWRPGLAWCCVCAYAYHYLGQPIGSWLIAVAGIEETLPSVDIAALTPLLLSLLGLVAYRTVEKIKGVQDKH